MQCEEADDWSSVGAGLLSGREGGKNEGKEGKWLPSPTQYICSTLYYCTLEKYKVS